MNSLPIGIFTVGLGVALLCYNICLGREAGVSTVFTKHRPIQGVTGVILSNSGDLTIAVGGTEGLEIEAEERLLPLIKTEIKGHTLMIGNKSGASWHTSRPVHYHLTVKSLDSVTTTSSGDVFVPTLTAENVKVQIHSSGDVKLGALSRLSRNPRMSHWEHRASMPRRVPAGMVVPC